MLECFGHNSYFFTLSNIKEKCHSTSRFFAVLLFSPICNDLHIHFYKGHFFTLSTGTAVLSRRFRSTVVLRYMLLNGL